MSHLSSIYVGMLTKNTSDSGTNSKTVLIVNDDGIDRLHHTFGDTSQDDQEQGQANVYRVGVAGSNIIPEHLNNSSVRVGIRGDDLWRPQHYVVWGERLSNGEKIPIAIETDINAGLSTDNTEGPVSLPLRLVNKGSDSMRINRLLLMMTTANSANAGTDSRVELQISSNSGNLLVDFDIPDTPQSDQEKGQANFYFIPVSNPFSKSNLNNRSIRLSIQGTDAWRISSLYLFGLDDATGRPEFLVPLVHISNWSFGELSTDPSEGNASVLLPLVSLPLAP